MPQPDTIMATARALGVPALALLALGRAEGKHLRKRLDAIVTNRCSRDQRDLKCRMAAVIAES